MLRIRIRDQGSGAFKPGIRRRDSRIRDPELTSRIRKTGDNYHEYTAMYNLSTAI